MSSSAIYVNNLPYSATEESITEYFSVAGAVSSVEVFRYNGRSKGCALVVFEAAESAAKAIADLNEVELEGRPLHIREDRGEAPKGEARPARVPRATPARPEASTTAAAPRRPNHFPPSRPDDAGRKVYVGNLSYRTEWQALKDYFRDCGEVIRADVARYPDNKSRGFGTVVFADEESAQKAIASKNDTELQGRKIAVRLDNKAAPAARE